MTTHSSPAPLTEAETVAYHLIRKAAAHQEMHIEGALCEECLEHVRAVVAAFSEPQENEPEGPEHDIDTVTWEDAEPVQVLYLLRNHAARAAALLEEKVVPMREALVEAEAMLAHLNDLSDTAEDAAQLVAASDLMPTYSANVPERSGLSLPASKETQK